MRLALAQINSVVGDIDGNAASVDRLARPGARGERRSRPLPRARRHRLPARGSAAPPRLRARGAARVDEIAAADARDHGARRRAAPRHRPLQRVLHPAPTARSAASTRSASSRTTASSTRTGTSRPAATSTCCGSATCVVGPTICEDVWQPGPPATDLALAGAQLVANISASPFHVGKDREREEMLKVRATDNSCFVALCNAVGGQDELIFDGHSVVLDDEGEVLARARRLRGGAAGRRHRSGGRRRRAGCATCVAARSRATASGRAVTSSSSRRRATQDEPRPARVAAQVDDLEQMRLALELGLHDYVTKNGFARRRDRALRRDRLRADRGTLRRGARRRPRARRLDAVALLVRGHARRRRAARGVARDRLPRDRDRADGRGVHRGARAGVRGTGARPDRGEPAGAHPRHAADGALEQVRLARDRDRQQVGALGRLLDAVRRPRGRVRADQGRLQDGCVPALAAPERASRPRADPAARSSSARRAPSCAPTSATTTRCRRTRSSTGCSRRTSSSTARARSSGRTASTRRSSSARSR